MGAAHTPQGGSPGCSWGPLDTGGLPVCSGTTLLLRHVTNGSATRLPRCLGALGGAGRGRRLAGPCTMPRGTGCVPDVAPHGTHGGGWGWPQRCLYAFSQPPQKLLPRPDGPPPSHKAGTKMPARGIDFLEYRLLATPSPPPSGAIKVWKTGDQDTGYISPYFPTLTSAKASARSPSSHDLASRAKLLLEAR